MYTLLRHLGLRDALYAEAPALAAAFVIAELFYKFHSFALECAAFLATWLVLSFVLSRLGWGPRVTRRPDA